MTPYLAAVLSLVMSEIATYLRFISAAAPFLVVDGNVDEPARARTRANGFGALRLHLHLPVIPDGLRIRAGATGTIDEHQILILRPVVSVGSADSWMVIDGELSTEQILAEWAKVEGKGDAFDVITAIRSA
jgi:hypothetical protein